MSITEYIASQFRKPQGVGGLVSTWFMNNLNRQQYKAVLNNLNEAPLEKVLDVGFGNGALIKKLAERSQAVYYGIDVSQDICEKATQRNRKLIGRQKVFLVQAGEISYLLKIISLIKHIPSILSIFGMIWKKDFWK